MNWKWLANGLLVVAALAVGMAAGWMLLPRQEAKQEKEEEKPKPVAKVEVVPLERGRIDETLGAYGMVEAAVGETETFSVPFECRVVRMLVAGGQMVKAGDGLVEIEPSPDARLLLEQALQERNAAGRIADIVGERVKMKLATQQDLLTAQQTVDAAQLKVDSMARRGIDGRKTLRAEAEGIVSKTSAQQGAIIAAGGALVEVVDEKHVQVRLGVETEDAGRLKVGQTVRLEPVGESAEHATEGTIRMVAREVDSQTRLVNVFVTPATGAALRINEYVRGAIVVASKEALIAPRQAVLPDEGETILYTLEDGHAVKHTVTIGLEDGKKLEVAGEGLKPGMQAITVGNSQLEDKMAAKVEEAAATQPETVPASRPESAPAAGRAESAPGHKPEAGK